MKKILAILLALVLLVTFSACRKNKDKATEPTLKNDATGTSQATNATQSAGNTDATEATQEKGDVTNPAGESKPATGPTEGKGENPTTPTTKPTEGKTDDPATPTTKPTEGKNEDPVTPTTKPTTPTTKPTTPGTKPTTPSTKPTEGKVETPTQPKTEEDPLPDDPGICSHNWGNATCTTGRICAMCGQEEEGSDPLGHNWINATCTAPKTCRRCGATEGKVADHDFNGGICTDCGEPDPNLPEAGEDELPPL